MSLQYIPARIVRGHRWYIEFTQTNPKTNIAKRERPTYGLNRIKDLVEREKLAAFKVAELNDKLLPGGYPYVETVKYASIEKAFELAYRAKHSKKKTTNDSYRSLHKLLMTFVHEQNIGNLAIRSFSRTQAYQFMDMVQKRRVSGVTYNKYKTYCTILFNELKRREYVSENPFFKIPNMREEKKARQPFSMYEKRMILERAEEISPNLLLPIYLIYYCFIRPKELRNLKIGDLNLKEGIITVRSAISKNGDTEHVTIPKHLIPVIYTHIKNHSYNKYVFGRKLMPTMEGISKNMLNRKHRTVLDSLMNEMETTDKSIYSWKDTGASDMLKRGVDVMQLMKQLRHKDLNTTQRYLTGFGIINERISNIGNIITEV